ncbi:MAG: hypothetical protein CO093_00705 [Alphaproteobacteria bacterium CG_4_9_14_3_um_filter_47_13]|nr:MAG: hypothetical protein CO093_00705 [Alphaproteobacteria bacterium CG_4_9_14_3_um_filter_47_13]
MTKSNQCKLFNQLVENKISEATFSVSLPLQEVEDAYKELSSWGADEKGNAFFYEVFHSEKTDRGSSVKDTYLVGWYGAEDRKEKVPHIVLVLKIIYCACHANVK